MINDLERNSSKSRIFDLYFIDLYFIRIIFIIVFMFLIDSGTFWIVTQLRILKKLLYKLSIRFMSKCSKSQRKKQNFTYECRLCSCKHKILRGGFFFWLLGVFASKRMSVSDSLTHEFVT